MPEHIRVKPGSAARVAACLTLAGIVGLHGGCGLASATDDIRGVNGDLDRSTVEAAAFSTSAPGAARPPAEPPRSAIDTGSRAPLTVVIGSGDRPAAPDAAAAATIDPVLIDAKVGDISGRPVYANEILRPLAARLSALAREPGVDEARWTQEALGGISRAVGLLVRDELLRAEALSRLKPEQRAGLRNFINELGEQEISRARGSRAEAEERLLRENQETFDEYLARTREEQLVNLGLADVFRGINVSWTDIRRAYERERADRWQPPPTAVFRQIRVPTSAADDVEAVAARLVSGEAFESVASSEVNRYEAQSGGAVRWQFEGELTDEAIFPIEQVNTAAVSLSPGQTAGPFAVGLNTFWVHLEAIERVSVPLYEAQVQIAGELRRQARQRETARYIATLIDRANVTGIDTMTQRLLEIARARYGPGAVAPDENPRETGPERSPRG